MVKAIKDVGIFMVLLCESRDLRLAVIKHRCCLLSTHQCLTKDLLDGPDLFVVIGDVVDLRQTLDPTAVAVNASAATWSPWLALEYQVLLKHRQQVAEGAEDHSSCVQKETQVVDR